MIHVKIFNENKASDYFYGATQVFPFIVYRCHCGYVTNYDYFDVYRIALRKIRYCKECKRVLPVIKDLAPGGKSRAYRLGLHGYHHDIYT